MRYCRILEDKKSSNASAASTCVDLETPTRRGDVIAAVLCLMFGLVGYFVFIPMAVYVPEQFVGTGNSPAFLPKVMFILLGVLSALYLGQSLIVYKREAQQGHVRTSDWLLAGGTALICIGFIIAIHIVGMTVGAGLTVAITIFYFGERRPLVIAGIAIILPLLLWYFFVKIAHILFPSSWLGLMDWLEAARPAISWFA